MAGRPRADIGQTPARDAVQLAMKQTPPARGPRLFPAGCDLDAPTLALPAYRPDGTLPGKLAPARKYNEALWGEDMAKFGVGRRAVIAAFVLGCLLAGGQAGAQSYPARDITFIVAFAPGGVADTVARLIGQGLSAKLGRIVVVENRGGAGGNIAAAAVARAAPDGYTVLVTTTALAINETLRPNKGFAASDFKTVAVVASSPESLITSVGNPAVNLADFIKSAKGKSINFGTAGVGSGSHIAAEYFFKEIAKISAVHVPFQGGAPALNATIGGQIDLLATTLGGGPAAQIAGGKVKGLGVASAKRVAVVPNVPTYAEAGYPNFEASSWVGVFVPAGTSAEVVAKLNAATEAVLQDAQIEQRLTTIGFDPIRGTQEQAESYFRAEVVKWGKMVQTLGLTIN